MEIFYYEVSEKCGRQERKSLGLRRINNAGGLPEALLFRTSHDTLFHGAVGSSGAEVTLSPDMPREN